MEILEQRDQRWCPDCHRQMSVKKMLQGQVDEKTGLKRLEILWHCECSEMLDLLQRVAKDLGEEDGAGSQQWCDLSGEWADSMTPTQVLNNIRDRADCDWDPEAEKPEINNSLVDIYCESFDAAAQPTVLDDKD